MVKKPLPEGGQLVNIVCNLHRRPSRLHVFTKTVQDSQVVSDWSEFPSAFPPAAVFVDDKDKKARYIFDPEAFDLRRRRLSYSFKCERCGAGPVVVRAERLHPILSQVWESGKTRLALQDLADMING